MTQSAGIDVTTIGLGLLALVIALFALAAREQKTPYITTTIYSTVLIVLAAIACSALSKVLLAPFPTFSWYLDAASKLVLLWAFLQVLSTVWQARNRKMHFRDDNSLKHLPFYRWYKALRSAFPEKKYQYTTVGFSDELIACIDESGALPCDFKAELAARKCRNFTEASWSVAYRVSSLDETDKILVQLVTCFLKNKCSVQYATCTRHPAEFLLKLKSAWKTSNALIWEEAVESIVAVDAYTPHFGFTDSVHAEATRGMKQFGVTWITAKASFASLHAAAGRAFNKIKKATEARGSGTRRPALVIYDGPSALIDLESAEQYRIFLRHVIASERLWGGMFTVVIECGLSEQDTALLRGYADSYVDRTVPLANE